MHKLMKYIGAGVCALIAASCTNYAPLDMEEKRFTRAEVVEDYDAFLSFVRTTHPKLEYSADIAALDEIVKVVRESFHDNMTQRDAWTAMAITNPLFGDAHVGLLRPVEALASYEENGGRLFPVPVVIDSDGTIRIAEAAPARIGVDPGEELLSVTARVTEANIKRLPPGAELGAVVTLPFQQTETPTAEKPGRFRGKVSRRGVIPDIAIDNDPLDAMSSVNVLLGKL